MQYVEVTEYATELHFCQGGVRTAPARRAGLVEEVDDALCNQTCKGDLARRTRTDTLLPSLGLALRT